MSVIDIFIMESTDGNYMWTGEFFNIICSCEIY